MSKGNVVDLHREVSVGLLKASNAFAVRTPPMQKDPGHYGWDPKLNDQTKSDQTIHLIETSEDNLGIHLFGGVIDVDVDTDNPLLAEALDFFLPYTPHTWGRGDRKKTHRLYQLAGVNSEFVPESFPFLKTLKKTPDIEVEVRGGKISSGQYSLLPGSKHPSGESYEWEDVSAAKSTPIAVDVLQVVNGLRFACVSAIIGALWVEGQRNDMCMALSGFLYKAWSHIEEMGGEALPFNKDDAMQILECVMQIADDDPQDRAMRIKTFEKTWDKAESGHPVTGATTIAKMSGDENIVSVLYSLVADTPDLRELDDFMERFAVRNNTSNIIDLKNAGSKEARWMMTVNDFRNSNMHRLIVSGSGARVPMTNILLGSKRAIRVDGFAFVPGEERLIDRRGGLYVNQWHGFAIEPYDGHVTETDVEKFLEYVRVILSQGDLEHERWLLSWLADMFQNPGTKPGTALVMVGKPGSGKSFLGEKVIRPIIGTNHSMQTNSVENLTNNFNMDSTGMLFIQCDEAHNSRRRSDANKMKSMISDHTRRVEPKGMDGFQVEDCARYMLTSNEEKDAVAIVDGMADRRYTVLKVNEDYAHEHKVTREEKEQFWDELHEWARDKTNLAKLHKYFLQYMVDSKLIRRPLETEARRHIGQHSSRGFDDWLMTIASSEHPFENLPDNRQRMDESYVHRDGKYIETLGEWPDYVAYKRIEDSYDSYRRRRGNSGSIPTYNAQQIKQELIEAGLIPPIPKSARVTITVSEWAGGEEVQKKQKLRITQWPTKSAIQKHLKEKLGFEVVDEHLEDVEVDKTDYNGVDF